MVVIKFKEQLQPNTFEFTFHHLIEHHIDLTAFYDKYQNEKGGRSAYDPAILLVCDQQGLLGHELIAIDGCNMRSNTVKEHSGTLEELAPTKA